MGLPPLCFGEIDSRRHGPRFYGFTHTKGILVRKDWGDLREEYEEQDYGSVAGWVKSVSIREASCDGMNGLDK